MIEQISVHHEKEYGEKPTVITSAPGKVDLLGDHGEVGQGYVLSLAIDRRFFIAASRRSDNSLRFFSANLNERKKSTIAGLKYKREDRWANYSKGVIDALIHMGFNIRGLNLTLFSEVPMGIGLASSSALVVATVCAIKELFSLDISDARIIDAARSSESHFMDLHEGIRSPMVSYYSRSGFLTLLDVRSLKVDYLEFPGSPATLLVTDSRVQETMSDDEKGEIDASCRECVQALDVGKSGMLFRDLSRDDLSSTIDGLSERSRRICLHVIKENARIHEFGKALKGGYLDVAGRILFRSHESLRDLLEISCPELDWLAKRAMETGGIYGSRMIGSGYGGCTVTLIDGKLKSNYEERLEEYDRIFGFKASVFQVQPGEGARIHLSDR
ncbi:MAG: galactokinase [Spirochaetes bacterium]|nr:MAG: galactokinase [Spirochaetota bacterium]RKX90466.1 MAG: galactokinase [Spirochaetota bacterium]RKX93058.1 MAG: galactokinase [Spirochaetota bacterium]